MTLGDVRVQVDSRSMRWSRPRRVVFGRKHSHTTEFGEDFWGLGVTPSMSRHWFAVEDVTVAGLVGGERSERMRVRCTSTSNRVLVWEGREPVTVLPGCDYLAQGDVLFVGDLVEGLIRGALVSVSPPPPPRRPVTDEIDIEVAAAASDPGVTPKPPGLDLSVLSRDVILARYHRYYRLPPDFDPQPTPWDRVAVSLGLLSPEESGNRSALRKAVKDAQEAITRLKQRVEVLHPGWLPTASETQKSFHDHLRTTLEMHRVFEEHEIAAFDARHPSARRLG